MDGTFWQWGSKFLRRDGHGDGNSGDYAVNFAQLDLGALGGLGDPDHPTALSPTRTTTTTAVQN